MNLRASNTPAWQLGHSLTVVGGLILMAAIPYFVSRSRIMSTPEEWSNVRPILWAISMAIAVVVFIAIGDGIRGGALGALINKENRMSLTQLQLCVWTILVVSGFFVAALTNVNIRSEVFPPDAQQTSQSESERMRNSMEVSIPAELWLLLGINIASVAGTSIIKNAKGQPNNTPTDAALEQRGMKVSDTGQIESIRGNPMTEIPQGVLLCKATPDKASFSDLFSGVEVGNARTVDVGKVQMFFFTGIVILGYGGLIGAAFGDSAFVPFSEFPSFSESVTTLIAISHAGYLTNLAVPHTQTVPTGT